MGGHTRQGDSQAQAGRCVTGRKLAGKELECGGLGEEAAGKTGQAEKDLFLKLSSLFLRARIRQKAFYGSNGLVFSLERSAWQNVEESLNEGQSKG